MIVNISDVPDEMLLKIRITKNINRARLLKENEKQAINVNGNDVVLISPINGRVAISRMELVKNYRTTDGKKIKLRHWHNGKQYNVYTDTNVNATALRVPKSSKTQINLGNKMATVGTYVIILKDNKGNAKYIELSPRMFKKMCTIEQMYSVQGMKKKNRNLKVTRRLNLNKDRESNNVDSSSNGSVNNNIGSHSRNVVNNNRESVEQKFSVVARLMNRDNKLIGFVISDGRMEKNVNKEAIMELCRKNKMRNITIVESNNKEYLRGVGIQISNLPQRFI